MNELPSHLKVLCVESVAAHVRVAVHLALYPHGFHPIARQGSTEGRGNGGGGGGHNGRGGDRGAEWGGGDKVWGETGRTLETGKKCGSAKH